MSKPQVAKKDNKLVSWKHPGGKLLRLGSDKLTDEELIAIIIGSGVPGTSVEEISTALFKRFQSYRGMAGQDYEEFAKIKGLNKVKIVRIFALFEIAKRIAEQILAEKDA